MNQVELIRARFAQLLANRGDTRPFTDDDELVLSGRFDSVDIIELVTFVEQTFGVDFGSIEFDPSLFESVAKLDAFVTSRR